MIGFILGILVTVLLTKVWQTYCLEFVRIIAKDEATALEDKVKCVCKSHPEIGFDASQLAFKLMLKKVGIHV
jgi:hypothetical protein